MTTTIVQSTNSKAHSGFDPKSIPSCVLWLDAADTNTMSVTNSFVTQWRDKSGNANHGAQYGGSFATLSNQGVVFTGGEGYNTPLSSVMVNQTGFIILSHTSDTNMDVIGARFLSGSPGIQIAMDASVQRIRQIGGTVRVTGATNALNTRFLYEYNYVSAGAAGSANIYRNGTLTGTSSATSGTLSGSGTIMVGGYADTGFIFGGMRGTINEFILFDSILNTQQRQVIEGYLARKWGLATSLPASHPFRSIPLFSRPFQPTDIDSCLLWLDAADTNTLSLSGTSVTQWRDKSGNGNTAVAGTTVYPVYQPNGLNSLGIIGMRGASDYFLVSNNFAISVFPNLCYFIVMRLATSPGISGILSTRGRELGTGSGTNLQQFYYTNVQNVVAVTIETWGIAMLQNTIASGTMGWNGTMTGGYASGTGADESGGFRIGSYNSGGTPPYSTANANFDVAEIIVYGSVVSTTQRQQIEGYLAWKWGIQANLPTTQPFKRYRTPTVMFNPLQVSSCALWLDAADPTTFTLSGANISQWNDKSGNSRNASQFNTGFATYNGSNRVQITTTGQLSCTIPAGTFSGGVAGFVVFNSYGSNATDTLISRAVGAYPAPFDMYTYNSTPPITTARLIGNGTQFVSCDTTSSLFRTSAVTLYGFSIAANLVWNETINGTLNTIAVSYNSGSAAYVDNGSNVVIGSRADKVTLASIYVYEIVLYSTTLSTSQRQQVEGYLAWKWKLETSLPTNHAYYEVRA